MEYIWIFFALGAAVTLGASDALIKRLAERHNTYLVAWLRLFYTAPVAMTGLLFAPVPDLGREFFTAALTALPLDLIALILYVRALAVSPLSLTLPFLSLTPVFLIVVPTLLIGERISFFGAVGVVLIALGGYLLNLGEARKGIFAPLAAISREKGSLLMIMVALIYAFSSSLGKFAVEHSHPLFFSGVYYAVFLLLFTPVAFWKARADMRSLMTSGMLKASLLPGLLHGLMVICHFIGVSLTKVAYLIAVKRLSLLIGIVCGHILYKEEGVSRRFGGAALMLAGFVLIVLFQ